MSRLADDLAAVRMRKVLARVAIQPPAAHGPATLFGQPGLPRATARTIAFVLSSLETRLSLRLPNAARRDRIDDGGAPHARLWRMSNQRERRHRRVLVPRLRGRGGARLRQGCLALSHTPGRVGREVQPRGAPAGVVCTCPERLPGRGAESPAGPAPRDRGRRCVEPQAVSHAQLQEREAGSSPQGSRNVRAPDPGPIRPPQLALWARPAPRVQAAP